jgi:phosphoribosyl 1,2-cyclic phosphodiesterase
MSLFITSLNSGSNGNCYYVGNENEAILVDAGISCRETEKRLKRLGLSINKVKAIFVSHEHCDHINGIPALAKNYNLPVYITPATLKNCKFSLPPELVKYFRSNEVIRIGELYITAFPKLHDASEPHSFLISCNGINIGVFTDIGAPCEHLTYHFRQCHAAFLEANYDDDLLEKGSYPYHLKKRISGGKGHLSNKQALDFFISQKPSYMSVLILSHLSKNNNCPQLVSDLFNLHKENTEIVVASRFKETAVLTIHKTTESFIQTVPAIAAGRSYQISLF